MCECDPHAKPVERHCGIKSDVLYLRRVDVDDSRGRGPGATVPAHFVVVKQELHRVQWHDGEGHREDDVPVCRGEHIEVGVLGYTQKK